MELVELQIAYVNASSSTPRCVLSLDFHNDSSITATTPTRLSD